MIVTDRYSIGHLGRTGGRSMVMMFARAGVEFFQPPGSMHICWRDYPQYVRPILGLGIRRLPHYHLSWNHEVSRAHYRTDRYLRTPEQLLEQHPAEDALRRFIDGYKIDYWFRTDYLFDDVMNFIEKQHGRRPQIEEPRLGYSLHNRDPLRIWTMDQIEELYARCPTWSAIEKKVYGRLWLEEVQGSSSYSS